MTTQDTRQRVLDAAEDLFFTSGITSTGVDKVASEANVAIATLYKYSGNKDNLLREVLARRLSMWIDHWDAALAAAQTPADRLMAIFDAFETFRATARPAQWCTFLATSSELPPTKPDEVSALVERDTQLIVERLQQLAAELSVSDPPALAAGILLIYNGLLASLLRGAPADPLQTARDLARSLIRSSSSTSIVRRRRNE